MWSVRFEANVLRGTWHILHFACHVDIPIRLPPARFVSKILKDLAVLRSYIQGFTLPADFSVNISESDTVSGLKKSKALTEEQQTIGMKLDNLLKLKNLGYDVSPEMIEEVGYQKEFIQQSQITQ